MDKIKEEIRLLLAFVISIFIILIFNRVQISKYSKHKSQIQQFEKTHSNQEEKEKIIPEGENYEFENNSYYLKIDKKSGYIKKIGLKKFLRKGEKFFPIGEGGIFLINFQFLKDKEYDIVVNNNFIILKKEFDDFFYQKTLVPPENDYYFMYNETIKNKTKNDKTFEKYNVEIIKIHLSEIKAQRTYIPTQLIVGINKIPIFLDPLKIKEEKNYKNCKYIGFNIKASLFFIYLPSNSNITIKVENGYVNVVHINENFLIKANEEKTIDYKFYAGPSDYFVAKNYIKEDIFGHGFFTVIGRFLFSILNSIYKVVPNWGWSIILLTFIIKILFFPLTRKSLYSMKQLQKLRPYLQDIQKKYKDNPMQLQKELMNIYKEYNINPFAGCLPTFIQIPIFIGFFLALRNSVFLRGAPFILWIKDLSMPDTVYKIGGLPVNILPILMTITSYFQQKLTPSPDQSQKSLTIIMPLMFLFILYNFPSGLLLYWVTMNIASLIEQYLVSKNFPKIKIKNKNFIF